jgi:hypothetical protein
VGLAVKQRNKNLFKGRQFTAEIIVWAVRWYLQFPISYRDLERMFSDRGIQVDHTTMFRWIQAFASGRGSAENDPTRTLIPVAPECRPESRSPGFPPGLLPRSDS